MAFFAKKSLGQNFLIQPQIVRDIVDAADVMDGQTVVEVGPGTGLLTKELLARGARVIAVEKDDRLIATLNDTFAEEHARGDFTLIHQDILEALPPVEGAYKVVANIPYYITGKIIRLFLEREHKPTSMTLLVQKEVAERIIATGQKESLLSVSIKAYGRPTYVRTVKAGNFRPAPSVDSAVIHIKDITAKNFTHTSEAHFFKIVRQGFASKRKKLSTNLKARNKDGALDHVFATCSIEKGLRAEDLSVEQWVCLSQHLK